MPVSPLQMNVSYVRKRQHTTTQNMVDDTTNVNPEKLSSLGRMMILLNRRSRHDRQMRKRIESDTTLLPLNQNCSENTAMPRPDCRKAWGGPKCHLDLSYIKLSRSRSSLARTATFQSSRETIDHQQQEQGPCFSRVTVQASAASSSFPKNEGIITFVAADELMANPLGFADIPADVYVVGPTPGDEHWQNDLYSVITLDSCFRGTHHRQELVDGSEDHDTSSLQTCDKGFLRNSSSTTSYSFGSCIISFGDGPPRDTSLRPWHSDGNKSKKNWSLEGHVLLVAPEDCCDERTATGWAERSTEVYFKHVLEWDEAGSVRVSD